MAYSIFLGKIRIIKKGELAVQIKEKKQQYFFRSCRLFWTFSLAISAAILFSLIFVTARKFLYYNIIVEQSSFEIPVGEVPFPAVTICPDSLVFEKIFEFEEKSQNGNFSSEE